MRTKLLVHFCPYCGSQDVHLTDEINGPELEAVVMCCLSCDEEFCVDRMIAHNEKKLMTNKEVK
jgi:hypothetical protein